MNKTRLVHFLTTDNLLLPGLLYEPDKKTDKVIIYLHGNGSSSVFYKPEINEFAEIYNKHGYAFFPFNNRGAHFIKSLTRIKNGIEEKALYGMTYELIEECVADIDGAVSFLQSLGYTTFILVGHSSGANKAVVYNYRKPNNKISRFVLEAGGDDSGLHFARMGKDTFLNALSTSQKHISMGKGRKLAPKRLVGDLPISYQSLFDTINPDGLYNTFSYYSFLHKTPANPRPIPHTKELFVEVNALRTPTFVVYGSEDEYCYGRVEECMNIFSKNVKDNSYFSYSIIQGADHGFTNKEGELANTIVNWLAS